MIVRLTDAQFAVCLDCTVDWLSLIVVDAETSNVLPTKADYDLPYIVWVAVFKELYARAYMKREWRGGHLPARVVNTIKALAGALNAWERHPALRNIAVLNYQSGPQLPAWPMPFGYAWASTNTARPWITDWAPFPIEGVTPVVLRPDWFTQRQGRMTRWLPVEGLAADHHRIAGEDALRVLAATFLIPVHVPAPTA